MTYLADYIRSYGADPEFFVKDTRLGKHISPHEITTGTKAEPEPIIWEGKEWGVQVDGLALEINTPVFGHISELFYKTKEFIKGPLSQLVRQRTGNRNLTLSKSIVNTFGADVWDSVPDCNKELGCSPDFDADTGRVNESPIPEHPRFRTTSGHISFGWDYDGQVPFEEARAVINNLVDVGAHYRLLSRDKSVWNQERVRRRLYGKYFAFRPRPYGAEWRAPSNAWCFAPAVCLKSLNFDKIPFLPDVLARREQ